MPSVSKAQRRLMLAAAHTAGGYGGVPQSVGRDYVKADTAQGTTRLPERVVHKAEGGSYPAPFKW